MPDGLDWLIAIAVMFIVICYILGKVDLSEKK